MLDNASARSRLEGKAPTETAPWINHPAVIAALVVVSLAILAADIMGVFGRFW